MIKKNIKGSGEYYYYNIIWIFKYSSSEILLW